MAAQNDPTPLNPRRTRRRSKRFYSVLEDRTEWELAQLAKPTLGPEISVLRLHIDGLLDAENVDSTKVLRAMEVVTRMIRVQQSLPTEPGEDALDRFGHVADALFAEDGA